MKILMGRCLMLWEEPSKFVCEISSTRHECQCVCNTLEVLHDNVQTSAAAEVDKPKFTVFKV